MKTTIVQHLSLRVFLIYLFFMYCNNLKAQTGLTLYTDLGKNNASQGLFIKSAAIGHFKIGKYMVKTGYQVDLMNNNKSFFSGYTINASRHLRIQDIPLELQGFYIRTSSTEILRETNWGTLLSMRLKRFEMTLGTNFRTYNFINQAIKDFEMEKNSSKIHEVNNLMYSFSYFLKPADEKWNVGLSVTNIDHFIINQETNPMFNLQGSYKISSSVRFYAQAWYKIAGASNLEVNHFGYYLRTGIIWNIN
jgi:hypothetical protein